MESSRHCEAMSTTSRQVVLALLALGVAAGLAIAQKPSPPAKPFPASTRTAIEDALASVLEGVTSLLVVHRPSTLALADRVALIDGGRVAAVGTHADLMRTNELYRALLSQEYEDSESRMVTA